MDGCTQIKVALGMASKYFENPVIVKKSSAAFRIFGFKVQITNSMSGRSWWQDVIKTQAKLPWRFGLPPHPLKKPSYLFCSRFEVRIFWPQLCENDPGPAWIFALGVSRSDFSSTVREPGQHVACSEDDQPRMKHLNDTFWNVLLARYKRYHLLSFARSIDVPRQ